MSVLKANFCFIFLLVVALAAVGEAICRGGDSCCSSQDKCGWGEGDCDYDSDCKGALTCGYNNCGKIRGSFDWDDDCCKYSRVLNRPHSGEKYTLEIAAAFGI